ncbi:MAG TPA: discoidin domain-containing protein [Candidatus Eisenbacteria bacterium]|nr:discoidin domain-containing protein [Candidatus Eisenbacteria bacterium]
MRRLPARRSASFAFGAAALVAALSFALSTPGLAAGAADPAPAACPPGNLLASARLVDSLDIGGPTRLAADDAGAKEGANWRPTRGIQFLTAGASLTYDLGADRPIAAALIQGDAWNTFSIQVSDDGVSFREVWAAPVTGPVEGRGQRTRSTLLSGVHGRFVRVGEATGLGYRTLSEAQVFCEIPYAWPEPLPVLADPPAAPKAPRSWMSLTRRNANIWKGSLAFLGAALLAWGAYLKRGRRPSRFGKLRDVLLLLLGIVGFGGYFNWGGYHFPERIHYHEFFHYFIGAKYFPELGYTHIYECASIAEAEQGFRRRVELRTIRDLRRNEIVPATYVLADPDRFKKGFIRPFTPERWESFKKDTAYFRGKAGIVAWERMLQDHGYNPSPVWNMAGALLSNLGPASDSLIFGFLGWIDPALILLTFGFIVWGFGWRTACVAALYFGTNEPAPYFWTGGAFLREDWLLGAVAGICFLKRGRPLLGGACLAYSTLLRVFPLGFFVAIGLRLGWIFLRERRLDRTGASIVVGAALATLILLPASSMVAGSASAWPEFLKNTKKHAGSPLTNYMGLRTIVGFRWETRQKMTYDPRSSDPFHNFREARKQAFRGIFGQPLFLALVVAYLALLMWGLRREMEWWVLAAFGFGVITISMELTCYYFSFVMIAALLWEKRPAIGVWLLVLATATQAIEFATYYYDMRYLLESVAVVAFVIWVTWLYGRSAVVAGESAAATPSTPAAPAANA